MKIIWVRGSGTFHFFYIFTLVLFTVSVLLLWHFALFLCFYSGTLHFFYVFTLVLFIISTLLLWHSSLCQRIHSGTVHFFHTFTPLLFTFFTLLLWYSSLFLYFSAAGKSKVSDFDTVHSEMQEYHTT